MKFVIYIFIISIILIPIFVFASGAEDALVGLQTSAYESGVGSPDTDISVFVGNIIRALLGLLGILILIFILYGGYLWLASGGNDQMVKKAKDILTSAFIGLIIVLAAMAITTFIMEGITGAISGSESDTQNECATKAIGDSCTTTDDLAGSCCNGGYCAVLCPQ